MQAARISTPANPEASVRRQGVRREKRNCRKLRIGPARPSVAIRAEFAEREVRITPPDAIEDAIDVEAVVLHSGIASCSLSDGQAFPFSHPHGSAEAGVPGPPKNSP